MPRYRKKPQVVQAEQYLVGRRQPHGVVVDEQTGEAHVTTIHGQTARVVPGDWVITETDGVHHYPCKDEVFRVTYERVH